MITERLTKFDIYDCYSQNRMKELAEFVVSTSGIKKKLEVENAKAAVWQAANEAINFGLGGGLPCAIATVGEFKATATSTSIELCKIIVNISQK